MKSNLKESRIADFADIVMGQSPKSEYYNNDKIGVPFLQGNRTFGGLYPTFDTWCTNPSKIAKKSSVLMSVRAPVGDLNIAPNDLCIGRGLISISMKNGNNVYLYYLLKANVNKIISNESGTVFGSVNKGTIENIKLFITTNSNEQKAIANILSSLDEKIQLNNKINKNLEELAQTLYKRWFVDFEFPNEEGLPYQSSGGEMVESELGLIPKGWKTSTFGDFFTINYGKSAYKSSEKTDFGKHSVYGAGGIISKCDTFDYFSNTIIVGCRGTCGKVTLTKKESKITHNSLVMESNNKSLYHSYLALLNIDLNPYITGSTQPQITIKDLSHAKIVNPNKNTISLFEIFIIPVFEKLTILSAENEKLSSLRNELLPKLMSGEIEVLKGDEHGA